MQNTCISNNKPARRRIMLPVYGVAVGALLLQLAGAPAVLAGSGKSGDPDIAAQELERRLQLKEKALLLVAEGDALAAQGRHCDAADKYLEAAGLLRPGAAATHELRTATVKRLAVSGVKCARELAESGEYDRANARLAQILADDMAPDDKPALTLQKHLKDPDRFNPSLTPRHAADTRKVAKLLMMAEHQVELADYIAAEAAYNQVLAIDHTNTAARRGLEGVQKLIEDYHKAARDHTRLKMLNDVDRMYETKVPPLAGVRPVTAGSEGGPIMLGSSVLGNKLHGIIIPRLQMSESTISEAVAYLTRKSIELDLIEPDEKKRGVNIIWSPGTAGEGATRPVTLEMKNVSLVEALQAVCQASGTRMNIDGSMVRISVTGTGGLETRQFRVPPGFLSSSAAAASQAVPDDPFAAGGADAGKPKIRRLSAQAFLESVGVTFPDGGRAGYNPAQNLLTVTNTPESLDYISQFVESLTSASQRQALISFTLLKCSETTLREIGGEFFLEPFSTGGGVFAAGGTGGNSGIGGTAASSSGAFGNASFSPIPVPFGVIQGPVTAGLRSSYELTRQQSIDDLINITNNGLGAVNTNRSPYIAGLGGIFTNPRFQALLRGLNQRKGIDLSVANSVIVKSGQRATSFSGRQFFYPTEFDPPQIPQTVVAPQLIFFDPTTGQLFAITLPLAQPPVTPATPTSFQEKDIGSSIEVEANIGEDGHSVDLTLSLLFSEFDGFINYGTPITANDVVLTDNRIIQPVFSRASASAHVLVYDGQTVAVGGLSESRTTHVQDKVPVWGHIPIIGKFFTNDMEQSTRTALVYFVTVKIVDPAGERIHNNTEVETGDAPVGGLPVISGP